MINRLKIVLFLLATFIIFEGCETRYEPNVITKNYDILVVDGLINSGADSTIINLSRSTRISEKQTSKPEVGAAVSVESESNETFPLVEKNKGSYVSSGLNLNPTQKYRLRIKTTGGSTYLSDFVEVKTAPAIDEITWQIEPNGLHVYTSTHDATNNSRYYRWEYEETWIFYAAWESLAKWDGTNVVERKLTPEGVFQCWGNQKSKNIVIGSSAKLDNDVISESPITFVKSDSEKFREKYSILVKQYALTKEAYQFWQELQKNTESLGSIFDAQPSQLTGNIHNVNDAEEPVLGYISVGTTSKKRIYIAKTELPTTFIIPRTDACLTLVTIKAADFKQYFESGLAFPIGEPMLQYPPSEISATSRFCGDCTLRGTNKKPSFWP